MKKSNTVLDVLALLSLIGAHYTKYFADHKLGFVRWLNYNGAHLREALPLDVIKILFLLAALCLAGLAAGILMAVRKKAKKTDFIMSAVMIAVNLYYIYATLRMNYDYSPASFLIVPLIGLGAYALTIRNLMEAWRIKSK